MTGRRYVRLDAEFFRLWFRYGERHPKESIEIIEGLPADARFIGLQYQAPTDQWILVWESDDWPPTPEGEYLTRQDVSIKVLTSREDAALALVREAVDSYGGHKPGCYRFEKAPTCPCGFDAWEARAKALLGA